MAFLPAKLKFSIVYDIADFVETFHSPIPKSIRSLIKKLSELRNWNAESLQTALNELLTETGKKPAELFSLVRIAISFAPFSPALNLTLEVLGREVSLARLNAVARAL